MKFPTFTKRPKALVTTALVLVSIAAVSGFAFRQELSDLNDRFQKQRAMNECFIGGRAPEILGSTQFRQLWALSAFRGKVVVVDFTSDGCPYCGPAHQMLESLQSEFHSDDLVFVSVSVDETAELRDRGVRRRNIHWPVIWDRFNGDAEHPITSKYKIFAIPSIWTIGKDGRILDANALRFRPFLKSTIAKALKS